MGAVVLARFWRALLDFGIRTILAKSPAFSRAIDAMRPEADSRKRSCITARLRLG